MVCDAHIESDFLRGNTRQGGFFLVRDKTPAFLVAFHAGVDFHHEGFLAQALHDGFCRLALLFVGRQRIAVEFDGHGAQNRRAGWYFDNPQQDAVPVERLQHFVQAD